MGNIHLSDHHTPLNVKNACESDATRLDPPSGLTAQGRKGTIIAMGQQLRIRVKRKARKRYWKRLAERRRQEAAAAAKTKKSPPTPAKTARAAEPAPEPPPREASETITSAAPLENAPEPAPTASSTPNEPVGEPIELHGSESEKSDGAE
ncbi:MAG: hypothetical protein N2652_09405 [Kiritimatiellae bacterium]|nr:hypothetical protein [Kiritimatiellia bacterium]